MLFSQVTAQNPECVNHAPRWLLHVRGSALRTFAGGLPIWVHPPSSWIYLMPDPNMGEMGEAAVHNLRPRASVTWASTQARYPPGFERGTCMVLQALNGPGQNDLTGLLVNDKQWSGWPDLGVRLATTDGNPRPWGVFRPRTERREHLVVAPLAAGWPAWHTIDVDSGAPGALFYHSTETWRAERPAGGRRFVSEPPWLWIDGALDAVPMEQTLLYTTNTPGDHVQALLREKRTASGNIVIDVDFSWLCEDGALVFVGKNARAVTMDDEERAQIRGFLQGTMPERVAWLRSLRAQLDVLTPEARSAWRAEAVSWMAKRPRAPLPGSG
jgi:hypothetical protein